MKKNNKYLILTGALILIAMATKAAPKSKSRSFQAFSPVIGDKISQIAQSLENAGVNDPQLNFTLAQMLFETGAFSRLSKVAQANNNYSGIIWINKPYQVNATRGTARAKKEGGYYAKFNSIDDWAKDFKRILLLKNKPLQAVSLADYVNRLAKNKYFTSSPASYKKGVEKYYNLLTV